MTYQFQNFGERQVSVWAGLPAVVRGCIGPGVPGLKKVEQGQKIRVLLNEEED
jgi:hypothetical protein